MNRTIFDRDHETFRESLRTFIDKQMVPHTDRWFHDGSIPRDLYRRLGELGFFGIEVPEEYGGAGVESFKYTALFMEELIAAGTSIGGGSVHVELCLPYLKAYATAEQKRRWLPGFATGELMFAIAMTEPGTGSDLAGMKTTATLSDDGTHYLLNGAKTFITGGVLADRLIVCARTSPLSETDRRHGISLFVVDTTLPGYEVGRKLDKIGLRMSETVELSFVDVKVPAGDLLGERDVGFSYLGHNLPRERLGVAVCAYAQARTAVELAKEYTLARHVFGTPVATFQNTKFELAGCKSSVDAMEAVVDRAIEANDQGLLTPAEAASVKLFCTDAASVVIDRCLQLHGGYGYINEYPIARLYADNRITRIYGGTNEVMKTIIAKSMGL